MLIPLMLMLSCSGDSSSYCECPQIDIPIEDSITDIGKYEYETKRIGGSFVMGRDNESNSAYHLDGSGDRIELNNNKPVITTPEFTISVWAKMSGIGGGTDNQNPLLEQRNDLASGFNSDVILLYSDNGTGIARFLLRSNAQNVSISTPRMNYGQWHHYVGTLDVNNIMHFYIDGQKVGQKLFQFEIDFSAVDYVDLGTHRHSGRIAGAFNGDLDEFKVFECALNDEQVYRLYKDQLRCSEGNLDICEVQVDSRNTTSCDRFGGSIGSAKLVLPNPKEDYQIQWYVPDTINGVDSIGALASGTYKVHVEDTISLCCADREFVIDSLFTISKEIITPSCASCSDGTVDISLVNYNGTPPFTYRWDDLNEQTTSDASGLSYGIYTLTVTDAMGCFYVYTIPVGIVGIEDISNLKLNIYPNPSAGVFYFESVVNGKVSIYSLEGKKVQEMLIANQRKLDLSFLATGTYFILFDDSKLGNRRISRVLISN